jgi:hypothetical protein
MIPDPIEHGEAVLDSWIVLYINGIRILNYHTIILNQ